MNNLLARMSSYKSTFSELDKKIASFIIEHYGSLSNISIHSLANQIGVSSPTLSRFTKKIGFDSFQDFKPALHQATVKESSNSETIFGDISSDNTNKEILTSVFLNNITSLQSTSEVIDSKTLDQAIALLSNSQSCSFFGLGGSNAIASIAYHKFLRTSLLTKYHSDFHYQQMIASTLSESDCAVVISHSGRNKDTLKIIDILKQHHVPIIGITSYHGSALDKEADISLISVSDETSFRPEAVSSTVSQISILDALFMIYGLRHQNKITPTVSSIRETIRKTRGD